ncbi:SMI1/KNR4 family protein [Actinoplanes sp. NPDC026623]|uniref:SMI1/KNR4 family protein n=1 Tax=Actinoplanes sp. NPDC026623 TaxID=3155610 RepID=UPI0033D9F922
MSDQEARREVLRLLAGVRRAPEQPFPGGATEADLDDLAQRVGVPLPAVLVDWLRICKGEAICAGGIFGARPDRDFLDIAAHLDLHPQWRELGWLPVAGDGCGNHYVLVRGGEVAFVESVSDPDSVASVAGASLWMFLRTLLASG